MRRKKGKQGNILHSSFGGRAVGMTLLQGEFSGYNFPLKTDPSRPQQQPPSDKGLNTVGRTTLTLRHS